ncbi:MAG: hypothetical protein QM820_65170 [Minicystis sp.]
MPKFKNDYTRLGTADGQIHLPGTLGLIEPEKEGGAVRIIVSARAGGQDGDVRILREVITTVPPERVATLQVPIQFLCGGQSKIENGEPTSTCPEGKTCIAGTCQTDTVDPGTLPTYTSEDDVFGNGGCFDGSSCWTEPQVADLDVTSCTIPNADNINVALQTEGEGICGPVGCFVTLDADSPEGWKVGADGRIALPKGVCEQVMSGRIVNVVTTAIGAGCGQKSVRLPTCGPWSAAEIQPPPYAGATALAGGQPLPVALALGGNGVVWSNAGLPGAEGAVKSVGLSGGVPSLVTSTSIAPRALATTATGVYWTDAPPSTTGMGGVFRLENGTVTPLITGLDAPEGIAIAGNKLFWSDFQAGGIFSASLTGTGKTQLTTGNYPYRVAADDTYVYWTNEGTAGSTPPDGSVARISHKSPGTVETFAPAQQTPRALALEAGAGGATKAVWWVNFAAAGTVMRAVVQGSGALGTPEVMAQNLGYPNGIAVDAANVYWTNRGDGTVLSLPLTAKAGDAPKTLASGQKAPGAIVADSAAIYWVSEGGSSDPSGAVVRLPKAQ